MDAAAGAPRRLAPPANGLVGREVGILSGMRLGLPDLQRRFSRPIAGLGLRLGRYLPERLSRRIATPLADVCYALMPGRRRTVKANLASFMGESRADQVAREVFRNYARYAIESGRLAGMDRDALRQRIDLAERPRLDECLSDGEGAVLALLHLGYAGLSGSALTAYGLPVNVLQERSGHAGMDVLLDDLRHRLGMNIVPIEEGLHEAPRFFLAMTLDAAHSDDRVTVDFLGRKVPFSGAPARLALRTGARVVAGLVARDAQDPVRMTTHFDFDIAWEATGDEEADVRGLTQAIAQSLELYVRRFPEQWFAFQPLQVEKAPEKTDTSWRWKLPALKAAIQIGGRMPSSVSYLLADLAGDLAYRFRSGARDDVRDNMRHVLGPDAPVSEVNTAAREAFRNVARYYVDLVRLPHMGLEQRIDRDVRLHGFDILKSRLESGQGAVVATAHFGNPELAVQVGAILGLNMLVLAEPLRPPEFSETMRRLRSTFGTRYEDVSFRAISEALKHLRNGGGLAITFDRDIQGNGTPLPFFGSEARLPLGAIEMAARTGAALIPGFCVRAGRGFDIYFEEPLELVDTGNPREDAIVNARRLLERGEAWISTDPGQWMVLERIWKPLPAETNDKQPARPRGTERTLQ